MDILIPLIIAVAVGLFVGLGLSFADKFFSVPKDEKQEKLSECLPGANCGACGFSGCDGYAAALAKGEAEPNLCTVGGETALKSISEILGVTAEIQKKIAFVACGGDCDTTLKAFDYVGFESCTAASLLHGGPLQCKYGCIGLGDCAKVCDFGAITIENGKVNIQEEKCVACGKCVAACPKQLITLIPADTKIKVVCSNKQKGANVAKQCKISCISCMQCEKNCPTGAIKVTDNLAVIDYSLCNGCGKCKEVCKRNAII